MITFNNVSYTYPDSERPVFSDLNLEIQSQEFVLVSGPSGAGKSTFLRCLNGLVPHFTGGTLKGTILVNGQDPVSASPKIMSRSVGFVFQDPETQFVMDFLEDEVAFALENAAVPAQEIRTRLEDTLKYMGIWDLRERALHELSGGERQKVAIAAALVMKPSILALDEPTSQLDPRSAGDVLDLLLSLRNQYQLTIVLVEHRLERVIPYVDQMIYFPKDNRPVLKGKPAALLNQIDEVPPLVALGKSLGWQPLPLDVQTGKKWITETSALLTITRQIELENQLHKDNNGSNPTQDNANPNPTRYQVQNLSVTLSGRPIFQDVNLHIFPGEILALVGHNGAGKTTLLRSMVGLQKYVAGEVYLNGQNTAQLEVADICRQVGFLPQDPNSLLFADQVRDELQITLRNHNLPIDPQLISRTLEQLDLHAYAHAFPRDLSTGQRQRVAIAALIVTQPAYLLLDEPTRGLDSQMKDDLTRLLKKFAAQGTGILLVTHDVELVAKIADRVAVMQSGRIVAQGEPSAVLSRFPEFSPQILRLFPGSKQLTVEGLLNNLTFVPKTV
jgi:energy-coupling factor transport system ATP-binding protein